MRDLYATTMQLVDIGGANAFDIATERAAAWAWQRVAGDPPDFREASTGRWPAAPRPTDAVVEWWTLLEGPARAVELRLRHPDAKDSSLTWQATVTISDVDDTVRATVRLERGASVHVLQPWRIELRAPGVVQDLMRPPLLAYAGTLELAPGSRTVAAADEEAFIADVLRAPGRALPVLMAACDVYGGLVDTLSRALAGLAQVVRASDSEADQAVRAALSREGYEVPRGGLRLFWPGFGSPDDTLRHPYWTAAQLQAGRRGGRSVVAQLVALLAPISTGRVPTDPGLLRARREFVLRVSRERREREQAQRERARRERDRRRELERERQEQDQGRVAADVVDDLKTRIAALEEEVHEAEAERDAAQRDAEQAAEAELRVIEESLELAARAEDQGKRIATLEAESASLRTNLETLTRFKEGAGDDATAEEDADPATIDVGSWEELAEHLPTLDGPGFRLTDQALQCATGDGRYPHPDRIWDALRRLERVGRAYNELGARLNMRFEDFALQEGGLEVALQDSTYENDCHFEYDGTWYSRLPHVKIDDAKSSNEVGRVYFALDPDSKRLIVDWYGTKPDRPRTARR